jgi:hypothetical protein
MNRSPATVGGTSENERGPTIANLLLMSSPTFGEFQGVETAGESIRSHSGGALLSGHAFQRIENPGSGSAVREEANPQGAADS